MKHFYNNIFGFFNFQDIYSEMVDKFDNNSHFIEIGGFLGCSSVYMGVEILNSGKNIKFDVIDKWDFNWKLENGDVINTYTEFIKNIKPLKKIIKPIKSFSKDIVDNYENESIDFIFIDADHEYEGIMNDIKIWYPKVKRGGIIAGHDYVEAFSGVIKAVNEYFTDDFEIKGTSWLHLKK